MRASPGPAETRNVTLADLAVLLRGQQARAVDIVAPASMIRAVGGRLEIESAYAVLVADGVTMASGTYVPTTT